MSGRRSVEAQRWLRGAWLVALVLGATGCGGLQSTGVPFAQKHSWEESFNKGDAAAVAALYAPDAQLVTSGAAPVRGREAIRAEIDKMLQSGVKVHIGTTRAERAGDLAYFYGPYSVSSKQGVVEKGTYLEIWRRHHGRWLIELDVNS